MTKEEQQKRATLSDHIVIHKVTDNILAMHKDGTEVYAVEVIRKPLVRCKECKWYGNEGKKIYNCCVYWAQNGGVLIATKMDDYCSYGERRESDETD